MPRKQKFRRTFHFEGKLLGDRTFSSRKLADAWYDEMKRKAEAVKAGLPLAAEDLQVRAAAAKWVSNRIATNDYGEKDNQKMMRMVPRFGEKTVKAVTKGDCELVLHGIRKEGDGGKGRKHKELSGATFNRYRACLHTFFEYCIDEGIRETNPVSRIDRMPELQRGVHVPDQGAKAYLAHLRAEEAPVYLAFIALGMNCGARPGELLGLIWSDYAPGTGRLEIRRRYQRGLDRVKDGTKGGRGRLVPLNTFAIAAIEAYRPSATRTGPEDPIFQEPSGELMDLDRLQDVHERARAAAGLPKAVRIYDITRHKFASEVTQLHGLRAAQEALGHSSSALTERYAHSDPNALVNRLATTITVGGSVGMEHGTNEKTGANPTLPSDETHGTKLGPPRDLSQVDAPTGAEEESENEKQ